MRTVVVAAVAALAWGACPGFAGEVERLRAENQRLEARVRELEAENAQLRGQREQGAGGLAAALEERATEAVTITPGTEPGTDRVETESSRLEGLGGGKGRHWITWRADRAAAGGGRPDTAWLIVDSSTPGVLNYRDVQNVRLVVDGTPVECAVADYKTEINTVGRETGKRTVGETVRATVPIATLERLAAAHEVSGTLGPTSFRLTPEQLAALRAFAKRLGS
jgi:hypothetical protein